MRELLIDGPSTNHLQASCGGKHQRILFKGKLISGPFLNWQRNIAVILSKVLIVLNAPNLGERTWSIFLAKLSGNYP